MAEHNEVGKIGEELAVKFLKKKGYQILERNYRRKWCEIDIIAKRPRRRRIFGKSKEELLIFIEVKTRVGERFGTPEESVDWEKRRRLAHSAETYVSFSNYQGRYQIDVVCVVLNGDWKPVRVTHYENVCG